MRRTLTICVATVMAAAVAAQQPPEQPDQQSQGRIQQRVTRLFRALGSLSDWDTHSEYITAAIEKAYERNGWISEPDRFALDMIRDVNQVPPWRPEERFDRAVALLGDRYDLDDDQRQVMRETLIRESNDIFQRHSGRIIQYAVEAIQTRAAGEPFTPEQVARWAQLAEPVFLDSRERMNAAAGDFATHLRPEQADALLGDLDAANRRMDDWYVQSQRWAEGDWDPLDWGLDEDPIQTGAAGRTSGLEEPAPPAPGNPQPRTRSAGEREHAEAAGLEPAPPSTQPTTDVRPDDAWAQYVRRVIAHYNLNESQEQRAWRIYRDVKARGDAQRSRYGQQIDAAKRRATLATDEKSTSAARDLEARLKRQLDQLFEQLKTRLDRLPTRQQRAAAGPLETESPTSVPAPVNPMPHDGP